MRNGFFLLLLSSFLTLSADPKNVTPQQIQAELDQAQAKYDHAKKMFNPWYTGPLVTPPATMMPPGYANLQPYLFINGNYGAYNKDRDSISLASNEYSLQVISIFLTGVTNSVDFAITPGGVSNWTKHKNGGGFNDLSATVGFCITPQTLYVPGMKFTVTEIFPTGKYRNLSSNGLGLNSTGGGSYQSQFGFAISKLIWWLYEHPLNLRWFLGYTIQTAVHVKGFNTYGGGFHTNGTVHPGGTFTTDLGIEWSFTERWVLAMDVVYTAQNKTRFFGNPGVLATGLPAVVGSPYNDNLSLAPAIEYNWNENLGVLVGVQFSVYGRSSPTFAKGQFSVCYVW